MASIEVDNLVGRTLQLRMGDGEDWELLLVDPVDIIGLSLVGKLMTRKVWNKKLIKTVLGRIWGMDTGWDVKILKQEECTFVIGISFSDRDLLDMVIKMEPWL